MINPLFRSNRWEFSSTTLSPHSDEKSCWKWGRAYHRKAALNINNSLSFAKDKISKQAISHFLSGGYCREKKAKRTDTQLGVIDCETFSLWREIREITVFLHPQQPLAADDSRICGAVCVFISIRSLEGDGKSISSRNLHCRRTDIFTPMWITCLGSLLL